MEQAYQAFMLELLKAGVKDAEKLRPLALEINVGDLGKKINLRPPKGDPGKWSIAQLEKFTKKLSEFSKTPHSPPPKPPPPQLTEPRATPRVTPRVRKIRTTRGDLTRTAKRRSGRPS